MTQAADREASATAYDAVVIGCGPGGSTVAAELCRRGYSVLGIDKHAFPRYHIGESLTGTVGLHLRACGLESEMTRLGFPVKYGVKVVGRHARNEFFVAAAPKPTWQVRRSDFDQMLLDHAKRLGMEHRLGTVTEVLVEGDAVVGLSYRTDADGVHSVRSRFVIDASGLSTCLASRGIAGPRVRDEYFDQIAFFTQIRDCERDPGLLRGNTLIFYNEPHHWGWFIPLDEERVSVGIVITRRTYEIQREQARARDAAVAEVIFRWGLKHINPDLQRRADEREFTEPVRVIRDYSYRSLPFAGNGWICVGDSHRFIDPIFSFGVSIAMHEAEMAADAVDRSLRGGDRAAALQEYQHRASRGQDMVADVIAYFWRFPAFFGLQTRGKYRDDIMALFAGACYNDAPLPGLAMMRQSLARPRPS